MALVLKLYIGANDDAIRPISREPDSKVSLNVKGNKHLCANILEQLFTFIIKLPSCF